jgi:SAM-dependent methyltransferase
MDKPVVIKEMFYPETRFGGFSDVDGTLAFYLRVNALLHPDAILVDYGCGRGAYEEDSVFLRRELRIFKSKVSKVVGLDIDQKAEDNPYLDEFHLIKGDRWELSNSSVDIIVCDSVLEHLKAPDIFFAEARRVLKINGMLCIRTPNLWGYVAIISRLIPNRSHIALLEKVKKNTKMQDVFPTYYRCNTIPQIRKRMEECGLQHVVYGYGPEPAYLSFSKVAYWFGVLHQRYAPRFVQPVIFAFGKVV